MKSLTFLLALLCLQNVIYANTKQIDAIIYNGTGTTSENRLIAMTIAGIVNRQAPRLYLLNVYETWSYNQTDEMWRDIYAADGGVTFTTVSDINQLVTHFNDDIKGVVTYDPSLTYGNFDGQNFRWQAEIAAMIGGLTDRIPIPFNNTQIQIERTDSVSVEDHFNHQEPITIPARLELTAHPWNNISLSQGERYLTLLDWALETLLTRTNPRMFYLREITDWAIHQRMFQLNLAGTHSLQFASLPDTKAEKIERVMTYLKESYPGEIFNVYGWMRPEPLVQWISAWGGSFHETLLSNLSWHHIFPADKQFIYQRPSAINYDEVNLEDKYYVLFLGSEGDAGNWNFGFQSGSWHSSARGQIPVGWGFNLHFFSTFPFVGQYYFRTATPNDGFIAVTSPLGYAYTDMFPADYLDDAKEKTSWKVQTYNIPSVYAYKHYNGAGISDYRGITISNNYNFNKLASFSEATGTQLTFLFDPALATQRAFTQFGGLLFNHVNDDTFYADVTDLDVAAQRIINKIRNRNRPGFLLAGYQRFRQDGINIGSNNRADITLPRLMELMEKVKADPEIGQRVEFVTPEKFTWLLKRSIIEASYPTVDNIRAAKAFAYTDQHNNLHIEINDLPYVNYSIQLHNLSGRLVYSNTYFASGGSMQQKVPLAGLGRGVYIISISGNGFFSTQKIVL